MGGISTLNSDVLIISRCLKVSMLDTYWKTETVGEVFHRQIIRLFRLYLICHPDIEDIKRDEYDYSRQGKPRGAYGSQGNNGHLQVREGAPGEEGGGGGRGGRGGGVAFELVRTNS